MPLLQGSQLNGDINGVAFLPRCALAILSYPGVVPGFAWTFPVRQEAISALGDHQLTFVHTRMRAGQVASLAVI